MSEILGTAAQLQLTIPLALETDWATSIRDNCFQKIVEHDLKRIVTGKLFLIFHSLFKSPSFT